MIQEITNPDAIYQSVSRTGLGARQHPAHLRAGRGGGASGLLADLGYAAPPGATAAPGRDDESVLLCGAPHDPATPKAELANIYATLTEINHYSDPTIAFAAQYGADGQAHRRSGDPYSSAYAGRSATARRRRSTPRCPTWATTCSTS
ncbi:MAG: hypothetical protein U0793_00950 [Gemmataceae bacterium]